MNKDESTNQEFLLDVGDGHRLHIIDWGNKNAKTPIIFLHGGPGGGIKDRHKGSFDPAIHRVIFFDQRGCGKSMPYGSLENNTTDDLAKDITKIAEHLRIEKFWLHGYSWGSTLALYYAITYPKKLAGIVIGGVFSCSKKEIESMYDNAKTFYPDLWQKVLDDTPKDYLSNPTKYHIDTALNGTTSEQKRSTYIMDYLESNLCDFDDRGQLEDFEEYDPSGMQIELYYLANNGFIPEDYIADNAIKIKCPVHIVQGRFDMVCPPDFAYKVSKIIPNVKLYWAISNHKPDHEITTVFRAIFNGLE